MDIKVFQKEIVSQPQGNLNVLKPNIIDLDPIIEEIDGNEVITGCIEYDDDNKALVDQQCALATIWQKGLDPVEVEDGIDWSRALLGEISPIQIIEDITASVSKVSTSVVVDFDTVTDSNGREFLTYSLKEVI